MLPHHTGVNYCSSCGAKVITQRLTFRHLWREMIERAFNLDNSLTRTFRDMSLRPEVVIQAFLDGTRKRYLHPLNYLGIALTLSGVLLFLIQKIFDGDIFLKAMESGPSAEASQRMVDFLMDYSTFIFLGYIPILAIGAYLVLNKRQLNLAESFIAFIYLLAHWSILSFPVSLMILTFWPDAYIDMGQVMIAVILVYALFYLQRMNRFSYSAFFGRSLVYILITGIGYMILMIGSFLMMLLTGVFTLKDIVS